MGLLANIVFCAILSQVEGVPVVPREEFHIQVCLNGTCECEDTVNQIFDYTLQKCGNIVGSNCSIDFQKKSGEPSYKICVSNAECSRENLVCECKEGYEETGNSTCRKSGALIANDNSENKEIGISPYGSFCKSNKDCNSSENLICSFSEQISEKLSENSVCDCENSTYVYQAGKGCTLPSEFLSIKETMKKYRKQREILLNLQPQSSSPKEEIYDRTEPSKLERLEDSTLPTPRYEILDRSQYQSQNPFDLFQIQPNFQNPQSNTGNNFPNQNPTYPNNANAINSNYNQSLPSQNQQNFNNPQNSNNYVNSGQPQFQNQQNPNAMFSQQQRPNPVPSYNQLQQPYQHQPVGQYQQPARGGLLSFLLRPLTQLLTPRNYGNREKDSTVVFRFPFITEAKMILGMFARMVNMFMPVLRTLDYQISPLMTELGKFRYYENTNNNGNNNYQPNSQGFAGQQNSNTANNAFSAANPFQPTG